VGDEPEDIAIQLEWMRWVRAEMRRRTKLVRDLSLEENPEKGKVTSVLATRSPKKFGPIVVCVDECQVWFEELEDKAVKEEFTAICRDLIKRGPALGIIVLFATQKPDAKSIPTAIADNASARVCFKVNGQVSNDQVLGTSSYQNGIRATQFGFEDKGVAYYRGEGADALIVRSVHGLDATASDKVADRARAMRLAAGLLTGDAAEENVLDAMQVDLLEDVREVMDTEGYKRLGLTGLRERLALLRETFYGTWDNDTLGGALRGKEVPVEPVHCPVEKRTVKGIKRERVDLRPVPEADEPA
jgi:S-DNA-T family DNA segregation ATPase FtsK/SpoIIIE